MSDGNGISVRIQRGAAQIGGVCTELFTDQTRIFFDFGSPLEGEGNQEKLNIEGLTQGTVNTDAVFLTHYHGDHVGEIPRIMENIPVYMQKTARRILLAQQKHKESVGQGVWADGIKELTAGEPVIIKDLKITPLASDHSACDSLMYLIEGHGKRILITGDYRLHGFYGDKIMNTFRTIGHIDLMITEGTNLDRESPYSHDERWVREQFDRVFKENKYVFLLTSSSNTDRIASFTRAVPYGKHALSDGFQKDIMNIYDEEREDELKSHKLWPYNKTKREAYEKRGFGMVVRANDKFIPIVEEYFEKYPDDTCLIYSMWSGYKKLPEMAKMLEISKGKTETIHVSGHITREDLEKAVGIVAPDRLIIHHTAINDGEEKTLIIPNSTELVHVYDGEEIELLEEKMNHYKDQKELRKQCEHTEDTLEKERRFLKELAEKCREAHKNEEWNTKLLEEFLVDPKACKGKEQNPDHSSCEGFKESPRIGGEKQICHCMYYYNKDLPRKCNDCNLPPWKNVGDIMVEEFEYPSKYLIPGIGGIDLVLKYNNTVYGAEVKPRNSDETISRMISEILTYFAVDRLLDFEPAIAVFDGSKQYDVIVELEKNMDMDWSEIRKHVTVFNIKYEEVDGKNEFRIIPFGDD